MSKNIEQFLPKVIDAKVVPWEKQDDEWGVWVGWSNGDQETRLIGSKSAAEAEVRRLLAGRQQS